MGFVQPEEGMALVGSLLSALMCRDPTHFLGSTSSMAHSLASTRDQTHIISLTPLPGCPGVFPDADWVRYAANIRGQVMLLTFDNDCKMLFPEHPKLRIYKFEPILSIVTLYLKVR